MVNYIIKYYSLYRLNNYFSEFPFCKLSIISRYLVIILHGQNIRRLKYHIKFNDQCQ